MQIGVVAQGNLAHSCLPQLVSILDTIRKIFNFYKTVTDEKTGKNVEQISNILEQFDTSNTEGVDPINVRVF